VRAESEIERPVGTREKKRCEMSIGPLHLDLIVLNCILFPSLSMHVRGA
jgi:hypothetical protein